MLSRDQPNNITLIAAAASMYEIISLVADCIGGV
jgi:hypothetical protein